MREVNANLYAMPCDELASIRGGQLTYNEPADRGGVVIHTDTLRRRGLSRVRYISKWKTFKNISGLIHLLLAPSLIL